MNKNNTRLIKRLKIIALVVAAIFAAILISELIIAFTANKKNTANTDEDGTIFTFDNFGVELTASPISVEDYEEYGISPIAEKAYTLTATIMPETISNKNLTWSISFQNGDSWWASGKSVEEYVKLTVLSDTHRANIQCLQAFGEKIVVTVTSQYDSSKNAKCILDYKQKVEGFKFKLDRVNYNSWGRFEYVEGQKLLDCRVFPNYEQEYSAEYEVTPYGSEVYTLEATAESVKFYCVMEPSENFVNKLNELGLNGAAAKTYCISDTEGSSGTVSGFFDKSWCAAICNNADDADTRNKFLNAILEFESATAYNFKIYDRKDGTLQSTHNIVFDTMTLVEQLIVNLQLNCSNLIF